jgi:hypothetical protein
MLFSAIFPSSSNFQLRISQEKAVEIAVRDLTTKYIINPPVIKIYAIEDVEKPQAAVYPTVETFLKGGYIIPMAPTSAVNGTYYSVDPRTRLLEECHIPFCGLPEEGVQALKGRIAWKVELITQCQEYPHHGANVIYAIDTKIGQIIWSHSSYPEQQEPFVCSNPVS